MRTSRTAFFVILFGKTHDTQFWYFFVFFNKTDFWGVIFSGEVIYKIFFEKSVAKCSLTTFFIPNYQNVNPLEWLHFRLHFGKNDLQSVAKSVAKLAFFASQATLWLATPKFWLHFGFKSVACTTQCISVS